MSRSRHTEAQMIGALKQVEAGRAVEDVAREVGVSKHTLYAWKAKYGGMDDYVNESGGQVTPTSASRLTSRRCKSARHRTAAYDPVLEAR